MLEAVGRLLMRIGPGNTLLAGYILGAVLAWFAAREWYTLPDEEAGEPAAQWTGKGKHESRRRSAMRTIQDEKELASGYRAGMVSEAIARHGILDRQEARQRRDAWKQRARETGGMTREDAEKWTQLCRRMEKLWAERARALSVIPGGAGTEERDFENGET